MPSAEKRQRQKEHRRARVEEQLRLQRARRRRQYLILVFFLIAAVSFALARTVFKPKPNATKSPASAASSPSPSASATASPSASASTNTAASSCPTKAPPMAIDSAKTYKATMETSMGTVVVDLDAKRAPKTVNSVVALARCHFYDGLIFHRVVKGFVIQGGDPKGTGMGGPPYSVTETPPSDLKYEVGTVAMAKTGTEAPGTSGSQFFIVSGPQGASLPPQYALVGKVSSGQDVVTKIEAVPVDGEDRPNDPPKIVKLTIAES